MSRRRSPFLFACFLLLAGVLSAAPSPELQAALDAFRTEGPKGWAFTQTVSTAERSRVETFDPLQPDHLKMTLVSENGQPPTPEELRTYREQQTRRSGGFTAPNIKEQLDLASARLTETNGPREIWLFDLVPGGDDDTSAEHMRVTLTFHTPTQTIERVELASFEPFSPVLGVKVALARTVIDYSLPEEDTPSLLQHIHVTVRGRAFFFKSLDSDMTISYSDHRYAGKTPTP
ncbi:hypothetical protein [Actomonas aquatica]|uniref:Uncharacterized protein n=1 Tax=Actomonas aquatica TaxID=2866162 RepID=A0ABZ1C8X8_9BACT|nr:hypothetical protein [Opitutus sp. WL0086]WRQ88153.1 hypothetical protein K1X11_001955 [Opitutus sp. WL0086]